MRSPRPISRIRSVPACDETQLQAQFGSDLWTLAASRGSPLAAVTALSRSRAVGRGTFRLAFADGSVVKGRRCESRSHAEQVERLGAYLDRRHFPRVLKRHASALLEEWIDGHPLAPVAGDDEVLRRRGAILASIHSTTLPDDLQVASVPYVEGSGARLAEGIEELVRLNAIGAQGGAIACDLALTRAPRSLTSGLVHGDFCAENMLVDAQGHLQVVDNETVLVHAPEYDLARTWDRWPMSSAQQAAYEQGYGRSAASTGFRAHFEFWVIVVLVESALFRLRVGAIDPEVPLQRLRPLLGSARASVPR